MGLIIQLILLNESIFIYYTFKTIFQVIFQLLYRISLVIYIFQHTIAQNIDFKKAEIYDGSNKKSEVFYEET